MFFDTEVFNQFYYNLFMSLGLPLLVFLITGFVLAFLQTVTQIQDQVLSFVPKVVLFGLMAIYGGAKAFHSLAEFSVHIFNLIRNI